MDIAPVTNSKGVVAFTMGKQSGQERVLVTFDAGVKGVQYVACLSLHTCVSLHLFLVG